MNLLGSGTALVKVGGSEYRAVRAVSDREPKETVTRGPQGLSRIGVYQISSRSHLL